MSLLLLKSMQKSITTGLAERVSGSVVLLFVLSSGIVISTTLNSRAQVRAVSTMERKLSRAYERFMLPATQHTPAQAARLGKGA